MPALDHNEISSAINPETADAMAKYGITRVPVDYFHYKEFRYSNVDDAIAQAIHVRTAASVASQGVLRSLISTPGRIGGATPG
jgi:hypothetical protein